jgi:hypothetical protein
MCIINSPCPAGLQSPNVCVYVLCMCMCVYMCVCMQSMMNVCMCVCKSYYLIIALETLENWCAFCRLGLHDLIGHSHIHCPSQPWIFFNPSYLICMYVCMCRAIRAYCTMWKCACCMYVCMRSSVRVYAPCGSVHVPRILFLSPSTVYMFMRVTFLCIYLYVYVYACIYVCVYVHMCVYVFMCVYTWCMNVSWTHTRTHTWICYARICLHEYTMYTYLWQAGQKNVHICIQTHQHTYTYRKTYIYAYTRINARIHTEKHTYMHTSASIHVYIPQGGLQETEWGRQKTVGQCPRQFWSTFCFQQALLRLQRPTTAQQQLVPVCIRVCMYIYVCVCVRVCVDFGDPQLHSSN